MSTPEEPELWRGRWLLYALGTGMIAWGLKGMHAHVSTMDIRHAARFMVVGVVAHDGILAPVVFVLGLLTSRVLPEPARLPLQVGLLMGGVLALIALPLMQAPGRADNSSIDPLNYERNLTVLLALLAVGVVSAIVVRMIRSQR